MTTASSNRLLRPLQALLRLSFIIQTLFLGIYMRKSSCSVLIVSSLVAHHDEVRILAE